MLEFLKQIENAEMLHGYTKEEDTILIDGDVIDVYVVTVKTNDTGDSVEFIFHKGTEELLDMNVVHVCTCGHCKH